MLKLQKQMFVLDITKSVQTVWSEYHIYFNITVGKIINIIMQTMFVWDTFLSVLDIESVLRRNHEIVLIT